MKEMWDLYDRERNLLDKKVERGTKLNDNEYHLVTNAWIKNKEGKFLISQRVVWKVHPLMWECTGGSTTRYFVNCPDIVDVYIFEFDIPIEEVVIQKEEVNDVKWATKEEILELYNDGKIETTKFILDVLNFDRKLN